MSMSEITPRNTWVDGILGDFVFELILFKQVTKIAEIEILDVSAVREQSSTESRGDNRSPENGPSLNSQLPRGGC
jgi:hypothetical protein